MTKRICAICLLSLTLTACSQLSNPDSQEPVFQVIPTQIGNSWITLQKHYQPDGSVSWSTQDTVSIVSDTTVSLQRYFHFFEQQGPSPDSIGPTSWIKWTARNSAEGFVGWFGIEQLIYSYPPVVGQQRVFATDTVISVPAGSFHCIGYLTEYSIKPYRLGGGRYYVYLAPGIGVVREESYTSGSFSPDLYPEILYELISFSIPQASAP